MSNLESTFLLIGAIVHLNIIPQKTKGVKFKSKLFLISLVLFSFNFFSISIFFLSNER